MKKRFLPFIKEIPEYSVLYDSIKKFNKELTLTDIFGLALNIEEKGLEAVKLEVDKLKSIEEVRLYASAFLPHTPTLRFVLKYISSFEQGISKKDIFLWLVDASPNLTAEERKTCYRLNTLFYLPDFYTINIASTSDLLKVTTSADEVLADIMASSNQTEFTFYYES